MKANCSHCHSVNDISSKYCSVCGYKLPTVLNPDGHNEAKKITEAKPKRKIDYITIIGFIIGFVVVFFATQSLSRPSVDKQLAEIASEINKTCPINVDEYTELRNVVALPNKTMQYNYILVGISKAEVKLDTVKKYVFPGLLQNIKTSPAMKLFRDNQVTFNYYYADKDGEFVTEYIIKPAMYN